MIEQLPAQSPLKPVHLAIIRFVIVAREMKRAMNHQMINLAREGKSKLSRVPCSGLSRDDQIAEMLRIGLRFIIARVLVIGEGQDIGRRVDTAEIAV